MHACVIAQAPPSTSSSPSAAPPSPTKVMVSSQDGDKRAMAAVFRTNKVSPVPVLYAMVHPKPQTVSPKPQQQQLDPVPPLFKASLQSGSISPVSASSAIFSSTYADALNIASHARAAAIEGDARGMDAAQYSPGTSQPNPGMCDGSTPGAVRHGSNGGKRRERAAALSPLMVDLDSGSPSAAYAADENLGSVMPYMHMGSVEESEYMSTSSRQSIRPPRSAQSSCDGGKGGATAAAGGGRDRSSNDGSMAAMATATAVATAALDSSSDTADDGESPRSVTGTSVIAPSYHTPVA